MAPSRSDPRGRESPRGSGLPSFRRATSSAVARRLSAKTFASFHFRAPRAVSASAHSAARMPGTLLAAIDTPVPVQQHTTPTS